MTATTSHRLDGLEPDNLLAFLALLGLLRALEADERERAPDDRLYPRAAWDIDLPPLRPRLALRLRATPEQVTERTTLGLDRLASAHEFSGRKDLDYPPKDCRELLKREAEASQVDARARADLLAALMSDAAVKTSKKGEVIDGTPLCLLSGQGHQHFLDRLGNVPRSKAPPARGRGKKATSLSPAACLAEALFHPWHRDDPTFSFRWDPDEDVRYALMPGDPTDAAFKGGTQHGANRLAAIGLATLTLVPVSRSGRVRPTIVGGASDVNGFSFAWPVWRDPATLPTIRALLAHPDLRRPDALRHLGVDHVMVTRRISVGKFLNFSRARPLP